MLWIVHQHQPLEGVPLKKHTYVILQEIPIIIAIRPDNFETTFGILGFFQIRTNEFGFFAKQYQKRICLFVFWKNPMIPKSPFKLI